MNLTILIPTWDRPDDVNERLREIDKIWGANAQVRVQVNPGQTDSKLIDTSLCRGKVDVRQNAANFGMVANVVYGLQDLRTEWLWILGDDDKIRPEAKDMIAAAIENSRNQAIDLILFNQWFNPADSEPIISQNLKTLAKSSDFSDILYISGTIWRLAFFRKHLATFVDYAFSRASQALIMLASQANKESTILIINKPLIDFNYIIVRWSRLDYLQRITSIFVHPALSSTANKSLATELLWPQCRWAIQSAAYEQMTIGEVTLPEWLGAASKISFHLLSACPPLLALRRITYIFSLPLRIYKPSHFLRMLQRRILPAG